MNMKHYMKWLLGFTAFILLLLGATLAYTKLSLDYEKERQNGAQRSGQVQQSEQEMARQSQTSEVQQNGQGAVRQGEAAQQAQTDDSAAEAAAEVVDFTMLNMDGETISFSSLLGKPVILNFWATWCGPCQSEMPHIQEAYEQYGEDINFVLVNLTDGKRDTVDGVKEFVADAGYSFPVYFDTEMRGAYSYGAYSIPLTYFMDEKGMVVSGRLGAMTKEDLAQQIQALLGEAGQIVE